jgi:hypothetical protein
MSAGRRLEAGGGLALELGEAQGLGARLRPFEGEDDLGAYRGFEVLWDPLPLPISTSVRAYPGRPLLVFRTEAAEDLADMATGEFGEPSVSWPAFCPTRRAPDGLPPETRAFGYQYTEFALPTFSDPLLAGFFLLGHRPAVVQPLLLIAGDGRALMLAPLDAFHEQIIAVPGGAEQADRGGRCGWQGDLDRVPKGFASELAVWGGEGPRGLLSSWANTLRRRHQTIRPSRYADEGLAKLSYWTDNGAAYWYRSEPGLSIPETLERVSASLREESIPVGAFQLDSWFYPHQVSRPLNAKGEDAVPPTGMVVWEPREDILPAGIPELRARLGNPPLILHSRHFSSRSPYFDRYPAWLDGERAHPRDPELFERLMEQAASWGAVTYEQDWMVEGFLGVRGLREQPGRARAWQEGLDRAAADRGLTMQWCMASPADFAQTVTLSRVTSIRTSGDYRYLVGNGALWAWFLYTNVLARALGLLPFKDVFFSARDGSGWDGDPHAEAEALLASLSGGPVGIGDRVDRADAELVMRTCRADGVLIKPDVPIAALDRSFRRNAFLEPEPLIAETHSAHPAGTWFYVASFNVWREGQSLPVRLSLSEFGAMRPEGPVMAYDWRTGEFERLEADGALECLLDPLGWNLWVLCPILPGEITLFGDVSKYATMGDRRVRAARASATGLEFEVLGAPGESVTLAGWSARRPARFTQWIPGYESELRAMQQSRQRSEGWRYDPQDGQYVANVQVGTSGQARIRIEIGL